MMKIKLPKKPNNRGIAMELAIVTLLVVFALCSVLLTVTELGLSANRKSASKVSGRLEKSAIADDCLVAVRGGQDAIDAFYAEYGENYDFRVTGESGEKTLFILEKGTENVVLAVKYDTYTGNVIEYYGSAAGAPEPPSPTPSPTPSAEP